MSPPLLPHHRRGVALVIVLAFLLLITVLILGFFTSVTNHLNVTDSQASSLTTQQMADSAVNLVMAQLVDATKGAATGDLPLAWASQPGMVRTYAADGTARQCFKLYSSDQMIIDGKNLQPTTDLPPDDWKTQGNGDLYVDLNAPAVDQQNGLVYPIIDPQADGKAAQAARGKNSPDTHSADGMGAVLGFSIAKSPGYRSDLDDLPQNNRAPMPVRWLYVLRNGALVVPAAGAKSDAPVTVTGATKANPIVGRIAFWTDDDCAKVNINTASEGTYWDMPRVWSLEDFGALSSANTISTNGLAVAQPNQHEFQRYPGHPATTCLSPIFGTIAGLNPSYGYTNPFPLHPVSADYSSIDRYYNLTPRVGLPKGAGGGGSKGGTTLVVSGNATIQVDAERLYASPGELMFASMLSGTRRVTNTSPGTPPTGTVPNILKKSHLEKAQFFLTADSNAPEVTLFNTPRISVWPVSTNLSSAPAYDQLSAFCATVGSSGQKPYPFYFSRSNPRSGSDDYTARNQTLYKYLQTLTSNNIPGFGGNFLAKLGLLTNGTPPGAVGANDRDQLLTEIYDYIRSTNLQDRTAPTSYTPIYNNTARIIGAGEVIPTAIGSTQGYGRFMGIDEAVLLFYATENLAGSNPVMTSKMRALFMVQPACAGQALGPMKPKLKYVVSGLEKFRGQFTDGDSSAFSLNFLTKANPSPTGSGTEVNNGTNYSDGTDIAILHGRSIGGTENSAQLLMSSINSNVCKPFNNADAGGAAHGLYPFFSATDIPVPALKTATATVRTFKFTGNTDAPGDEVQLRIYSDDAKPILIQTYHFKFPSATFAIPPKLDTTAGKGAYGGNNRTIGTQTPYTVLANDSIYTLEVAGRAFVAPSTDTPSLTDRTVGDDRMVECLPDVPYQRFRPHLNYLKGGNNQFAHSLMNSIGDHFTGGTWGYLTAMPNGLLQPSGTYRQPAVPSRAGLAGVVRADGGPGDWDTGWGDQKDGAHINRPDEGDTSFTDVQNGASRVPYSLGYNQGYASSNSNYFSPTRQVPSPMMFGSLPVGVMRLLPWQTLSFAPRPEDPNHPGNGTTPKDHLLADLFWMPVVEPWAISTPFATAGKINLNYQIVPFSYLKRQTGLYAVMRSTRFLALEKENSNIYKPLDPSSRNYTRVSDNHRFAIDIPRTLLDFETRLNNKGLFRSATEICEMNLYPANFSGDMASFWNSHTLTGDNVREKPYVDLYPRLTTKSNTFTVHVRVQSLHKSPGSAPDSWDGHRDRVVGEYRGSSALERYIDPNDPNLPDFATSFTGSSGSANIDRYYKMRIVSTHRFNP